MNDERKPKLIASLEEHEIAHICAVMGALRQVSQDREAKNPNENPATRIEVDSVRFNIEGHVLPYTVEPSEFDEHGYALNYFDQPMER